MTRKMLACAAAALALAGCAFGQKHSYADSKVDVGAVGPPRSVSVAVLDQRPYVVDGTKLPSFVGLNRSGFGIPYNVNTTSGLPLAREMANAVVGALKEKGFEAQAVEVLPQGGAAKAREALVRTAANRDLLFVLVEWKTDSMVNTGLDYEVTLDVLDATGATLGSARVKGRETTSGAASSVEKDVQGWFAAKVAGLLAHEGVAPAFR